ncbi:hypothetical protein MRB53_039695 [Persea americana]|nr:hypothetical protein MRB53_039695 [Persea americana]
MASDGAQRLVSSNAQTGQSSFTSTHVQLQFVLTIRSNSHLSVYDKTGLLDLAKGLVKQNIRLLASGGTAKLIREAGFPVESCDQNINKVDYVICNLYPFKDTVAKINVTIPEAVEEIDIGGVTLIRAAARTTAESPSE